MGDIRALVGAGHVAARRLAELTAKYGPGSIPSVLDELFDRSEALARRGWDRIPDGTYRGSYAVEEDGVVPGQKHWVRVAVIVDGDRLTVDLSETDPQARGPINSSYSQTLSGILYALLYYVDPDIPMNEGLFRSFDVKLPLGSLVNPEFPAACNNRMGTIEALVDSINMALAPVCPNTVRASAAVACVFIAASTNAGAGDAWVYLESRFGPDGARSTMDANDCLPNAIYGTASAYGANVEAVEDATPVRCDRFEVWTDSGGPGTWRGGASFEKEVTVLEDVMLTTRAVDRCLVPPQGLAGGKPGRGGGFIIDTGRPTEWRPALKQTNILVPAGSTITIQVSGGGGYGDAYRRDLAAVQRDVRGGYVSVEGARRDYGVVLDPVTFDVDEVASSELRGLVGGVESRG
jgi:N-methylhydantoinase B